MINRIQLLFSNWQAERRRVNDLNVKLEGLTDPTFIDRATDTKERRVYLRLHDRVYGRMNRFSKWLHRLNCQEAH